MGQQKVLAATTCNSSVSSYSGTIEAELQVMNLATETVLFFFVHSDLSLFQQVHSLLGYTGIQWTHFPNPESITRKVCYPGSIMTRKTYYSEYIMVRKACYLGSIMTTKVFRVHHEKKSMLSRVHHEKKGMLSWIHHDQDTSTCATQSPSWPSSVHYLGSINTSQNSLRPTYPHSHHHRQERTPDHLA